MDGYTQEAGSSVPGLHTKVVVKTKECYHNDSGRQQTKIIEKDRERLSFLIATTADSAREKQTTFKTVRANARRTIRQHYFVQRCLKKKKADILKNWMTFGITGWVVFEL